MMRHSSSWDSTSAGVWMPSNLHCAEETGFGHHPPLTVFLHVAGWKCAESHRCLLHSAAVPGIPCVNAAMNKQTDADWHHQHVTSIS